MKKLLTAVCIFALSVSALGLAGCSQHRLMQDDLVSMGYEYEVVFDLAGGKVGERETSVLQVKPNSYLPKPGSTPLIAAPVREGYTLNDYYRGEKDEDGQITYGERWDFGKDRVNSDLTLYVKWLKNYSLVVHYGENFSKEKAFSVSQTSEGEPLPLTSVNLTEVTVIGFYLDKDKKEEIEFPYTPPCSEENTEVHIYADTMDGNWKIVNSADDFNLYAATNVYLTADIDLGGKEITMPDVYTGIFNGNGHTVKNFKVKRDLKGKYDTCAGIFGELGSGAEIYNVKFENVTLDASLANPVVTDYYAGMLAGRAHENVKLKDVTVTGTFNCSVIAAHFDKTEVGAFIGDLPAAVDVSTCDFTGVTVNKTEID